METAMNFKVTNHAETGYTLRMVRRLFKRDHNRAKTTIMVSMDGLNDLRKQHKNGKDKKDAGMQRVENNRALIKQIRKHDKKVSNYQHEPT